MNKQNDNDWFYITSNKEGTEWTGWCSMIYDMEKFRFDFEFEACTRFELSV